MKRVIALLMCMGIISCAQKEMPFVKQIDIDFSDEEGMPFVVSEIFEDVSYVRLDSSGIVGQIDEIKRFGDMLYLCSKNEGAIHQYDINGRYVASLKKRGRAGDEYIVLSDFDVSPMNGDIHVYDSGSKCILVYSKEGGFRRVLHTDDIIRDFALLPNGDYLIYTPDKNGNAKRGLWQTDSLGNFRKQIVKIDDEFQYGGIYPQYLIRIDNQKIGLMGGEDTNNFYLITEDSADVQLHINYHISIPQALQRERNLDFSQYQGKVYTKFNYMESHRWLWFATTDFKHSVVCFYDKTNNICHKTTGRENFVEDVQLLGTPLFVFEDTMIGVIYASEVLASPTLREKFPETTDNSNPILEIVKISQ